MTLKLNYKFLLPLFIISVPVYYPSFTSVKKETAHPREILELFKVIRFASVSEVNKNKEGR